MLLECFFVQVGVLCLYVIVFMGLRRVWKLVSRQCVLQRKGQFIRGFFLLVGSWERGGRVWSRTGIFIFIFFVVRCFIDYIVFFQLITVEGGGIVGFSVLNVRNEEMRDYIYFAGKVGFVEGVFCWGFFVVVAGIKGLGQDRLVGRRRGQVWFLFVYFYVQMQDGEFGFFGFVFNSRFYSFQNFSCLSFDFFVLGF